MPKEEIIGLLGIKTKKAELGWERNGKGWGGGRGVFPRRILSN